MNQLEATVSLMYPSHEIVPRKERAAWLKRWGVPPESVRVRAAAEIDMWERAGCAIAANGEVRDVSDAVRDLARWEAREIAEDAGIVAGEVDIPRYRVTSLLRKAAERVAEEQASMERSRALNDHTYQRVRSFAAQCEDESIREAVAAGYDVRTSVQNYLAEKLIEHVGSAPVFRTYKSSDIEPRNSPNPMALQVSSALEEVISQWKAPSFLAVSMGRVSRLRVKEGFMTVVPVLLVIPGVQTLRLAWKAE